ncbi:MAG: hypothetical protein WKG32_15710 [Gemmatimonadaceae bacterium]
MLAHRECRRGSDAGGGARRTHAEGNLIAYLFDGFEPVWRAPLDPTLAWQ